MTFKFGSTNVLTHITKYGKYCVISENSYGVLSNTKTPICKDLISRFISALSSTKKLNFYSKKYISKPITHTKRTSRYDTSECLGIDTKRYLYTAKIKQVICNSKQFYNASNNLLQDTPVTFFTNLQYSEHCGSEHNKKSNNKGEDKKDGGGSSYYHRDIEGAINQQILAELEACYTYLSMACYFGNTCVALPGCHGFYIKMHNEEHEHALKLINYQNMRGGTVQLNSITPSKNNDWESVENALEVSLQLERDVKDKLIVVHDAAVKHHDFAVMDFIIPFIDDQDKSICEFERLITRYQKMNGCRSCGCSEFLFDKELYESYVRKTHGDKIYV